MAKLDENTVNPPDNPPDNLLREEDEKKLKKIAFILKGKTESLMILYRNIIYESKLRSSIFVFSLGASKLFLFLQSQQTFLLCFDS
jgi:hypothetical protein